jgi:opacity protein-like surface antigen
LIRRAVLIAAAAVALILAPTAAMAYTAPGYNVTVSDPTPTVGHPITVNVTSGTPQARITLTIAPTTASTDKASTKQLNASGAGNFTVNFKKAGTFTLTLTDSTGHVVSTQIVLVSTQTVALGTQMVTVSNNFAGKGGAQGTATSGSASSGMGLAIGSVLLLLVLAGGGPALVAKRRKSAQTSA